LGHGGGIITWKSKSALLFALVMVISILPSVEGIQNLNTGNGVEKIGLNGKINHLEVNAVSKHIKVKKIKIKKVKKIKKSSKHKKVAQKKYKKVKAAYKYVLVSTKVKASNSVQNNPKSSAGTIVASGKCSCSLYTDYNVHTGKWVNYCPYCKKYGTLVYDKPSDCPEGMIRCTNCDADFCIVHGKAHVTKNPKYLTPA